MEEHDDLAGRVLQGFSPRNPTGYGRPTSGSSHGQAVAGIIAASHNNDYIAGVAPGVVIIPINSFDGSTSVSDNAAAIEYAWNPQKGNADVINNSWSYSNRPSNADVLTQQINNAATQGRLRNGIRKGCVVVFSAGNDGNTSSVNFPGNATNVISVGAVDKYGAIWNFSNRCSGLDVVAPSGNNGSGDVYTLDRMGANGYSPDNYLSYFGATSAAAPQVSGIAALILSMNPNLTSAQVIQAIERSGSEYPGRTNDMGYGLVNAAKALLSHVSIHVTDAGSGVRPVISACANSTATLSNWPASPSGSCRITWRGTSGSQIVSGQGTKSISFRKNINSTEQMSRLYADIYINGNLIRSIDAGALASSQTAVTSISIMNGDGDGGMNFAMVANPTDNNFSTNYEWRSSDPSRAMLSNSVGRGNYEQYVNCSQPGYYYIECRIVTPCGAGPWVGIGINAY